MNETTVELEAPAKYAEGLQQMLTDFRGDADRRLERIKRGEEPATADEIAYERETSKLAEPLIAQGVQQAGSATITFQGDAHLISNALDFKAGYLGDELSRILGTGPVEYEQVPALLEEIKWLNAEGARVDATYRQAVA